MIEGTVESLDAGGLFRGWLRDTQDGHPARVQIRHEGVAVAQALATRFRPDLLRGGHGHGHYGFAARIQSALPPGPLLFELHLPRHGQGIPVRLHVPPLSAPAPMRVEAMLEPDPAWSVSDLLGRIACLGLAGQRAAMGTARFVDVLVHFALRRWPQDDEALVYARALDAGALTPDGLLGELLTSQEREDLGPDLPSPWAATFPFAALPAKDRG